MHTLLAYSGGPQTRESQIFIAVVAVLFFALLAWIIISRLRKKPSADELQCAKCGSINVTARFGVASCADCGHQADVEQDLG